MRIASQLKILFLKATRVRLDLNKKPSDKISFDLFDNKRIDKTAIENFQGFDTSFNRNLTHKGFKQVTYYVKRKVSSCKNLHPSSV